MSKFKMLLAQYLFVFIYLYFRKLYIIVLPIVISKSAITNIM